MEDDVKKLILILILFICFFAAANTANAREYYSMDEWFTPYTETDWWMEGTFLGLVLIDWFQTSEFRRDGIREIDVFGCMGHEPDQGRINECIGFGALLHASITYALKREFRPVWNSTSIIIEGVAVYQNYNEGYGVKISIGGSF